MKKVFLTYWYNVDNRNINGYCLIGYNTEKEYFFGTKEECIQYANKNNMHIVEGVDARWSISIT